VSVGVDQLSERVWLGGSGETHTLVARGVGHLVDLRAEATPPSMTVPVDHIPIEDLARDQDDPIMEAARRVKDLADSGVTVGIYCQAGVSRTAAVAIAYLMLEGLNLDDATARLRACRPGSLPALGLWRSLEAIEGRLLEGRA
jgi:protein-tyrosine phosphatase